ncbi:hypothetical protein BS78_05G003700 [Paspalum vaginatum]|nr:hypothetical protein BS78_05G003700 [Paspalum vaginatum]
MVLQTSSSEKASSKDNKSCCGISRAERFKFSNEILPLSITGLLVKEGRVSITLPEIQDARSQPCNSMLQRGKTKTIQPQFPPEKTSASERGLRSRAISSWWRISFAISS